MHRQKQHFLQLTASDYKQRRDWKFKMKKVERKQKSISSMNFQGFFFFFFQNLK